MGTPNTHCLYLHEELSTVLCLLIMETVDQELVFDLVVASVTLMPQVLNNHGLNHSAGLSLGKYEALNVVELINI